MRPHRTREGSAGLPASPLLVLESLRFFLAKSYGERHSTRNMYRRKVSMMVYNSRATSPDTVIPYTRARPTKVVFTPDPLPRQSPRTIPCPKRRSARVAGARRWCRRCRAVGLGWWHCGHRQDVRPPHERHGHDAYPTIKICDHEIFVLRIHRLEHPGHLHPERVREECTFRTFVPSFAILDGLSSGGKES